MNLKRGPKSQRSVSIDGWNTSDGRWDSCVAKGSLGANDLYITGTDYALKKRILSVAEEDQLWAGYGLVRIGELSYLIEQENANQWRGGVYQYVYQLRRTTMVARLYQHLDTQQASGMPGRSMRTLMSSSECDLSGAGVLGSSQIDALDYSRFNVYIPGNVALNNDVEIDFEIPQGSAPGPIVSVSANLTLDVQAIQIFGRMKIATAIRRGIGESNIRP